MAAPQPRFEVVPDGQDESPQVAQQKPDAAFAAMMLALRTLSQRTIVALAALRTLLMVGSVFWLAMTLHEPNTYQLTLLGMYAVFILAIAWIGRIKSQ